QIGFTRRLLQILEDHEINIEHIPSGIDNLSIIIRSNQFEGNTKLEDILKDIEEHLEPEDMYVEEDLVILVIVGEGMKEHIGIATKTTRSFNDYNVNISKINLGVSDLNIIYTISLEDEEHALEASYAS